MKTVFKYRSGLGQTLFFSGALVFATGQVSVVATPEDDDADTSFTAAVTAKDAATIRAPRLTLRAAADDCHDAGLSLPDRLPADRHQAQSLRIGWSRTAGSTHRILITSKRAGEAWAPTAILIDVETNPNAEMRGYAADTTTRTRDADGSSVVIPTVEVQHAADSALDGSLTVSPGTDQDRWRVDHHIGSSTLAGQTHRLLVRAVGRAGEAFAPVAVVLEYDVTGNGDNVLRTASV